MQNKNIIHFSFLPDLKFIKNSLLIFRVRKQTYAKIEIYKNYIKFLDINDKEISFSLNIQYCFSNADVPIIVTINVKDFQEDLRKFNDFVYFTFLIDIKNNLSYYMLNDLYLFKKDYEYINN
jgi:hypothetical protein